VHVRANHCSAVLSAHWLRNNSATEAPTGPSILAVYFYFLQSEIKV
jgi:hypothetical protein